ncbi:MAG: DNA-processing protein DprA [bacterium]
MTPLEEDWLALTLVEGIGQKPIRRLLHHFGSTGALLAASATEITRHSGLSPERSARIAQARQAGAFFQEKELVAGHGVELLTLESENYPPLLRQTDIPPPLLYCRGEFPALESPFLAVVGTRSFSRYGEKITRKLVAELAEAAPDLVIVSGLARGIDTIAHQQALKSGLKTVAVMAGGLTAVYPPENHALADDICAQGALVTEFPMEASPLARNFPIRNRVISGLSAGILIVEAGEKSGALITAGFGLNHNREVFAVPGALDSRASHGTNRLIQRGQAKLVRDASDILEELPPFRRAEVHQMELLPVDRGIGSPSLVPPGGDKGRVLRALAAGPLHPDDLAVEVELPVEKLLGLLLELELSGEICQTVENQFALS